MVDFKALPKLSSRKGFLALPETNPGSIHGKDVVIVPFGLESSVSYGKGTANGPKAIIKASYEVELFDESMWCEPYKKFGITTLKEFKIPSKMGQALECLSKIVTSILQAKKFPLILGGEHAITPGIVKAFASEYKRIVILHFDAHADLRDSYHGNRFSHAAALRRCLDYKNVSLVSLGIRNISAEEIPFLEANSDRIKIFWAKDKKNWDIKEILSYLKGTPIYLTVDVDAFDSSVMPATGTPEPGGLFWDEVVDIITAAAKTSKIVGADINELAPLKGFSSCDFLAAKLAYKILSLV